MSVCIVAEIIENVIVIIGTGHHRGDGTTIAPLGTLARAGGSGLLQPSQRTVHGDRIDTATRMVRR